MVRMYLVALLLALFVSAHLCLCDTKKDVEGKPAATSYVKGWSDWAQGKLGSFSQKGEETAVEQPKGWYSWASDKFSSYSGRASKDVGKATEAGKEKVKAEGDAAAKEGQGKWESVKETAAKAKEGLHHQASKTYEAGKNLGSESTQKIKDAEL